MQGLFLLVFGLFFAIRVREFSGENSQGKGVFGQRDFWVDSCVNVTMGNRQRRAVSASVFAACN